MARIAFKDLYFGLASAEAEVARDADRFVDSFYDRWDIGARLQAYDYFLIVGPKGAGKTAISEYTRLLSIRRYGAGSVFATSLNLDDVSPGVSQVSAISSKLVSEQAAAMTDAAWRLFISIRLLELLLKDQSCSVNRDPQVLSMASQLRSIGLMSSDFPSVLRQVRENRISLKFGGVGVERSGKEGDTIPVAKLGEALQRIVLSAESDSRFLLSIDGLDRIIGDNPAYWLTLAALLRVGDDYHLRLQNAVSDIRLFVMCRSDVFRRIRFADSDKIAGDSSLFVDWESQGAESRDSPLWDYLAAKAHVTPDELIDFFPESIAVGLRGRGRSIPSVDFLLTSTRSTPREMTMLMRRLQEAVPRGGYVTSDRVRSAVDVFASRDLLTTVEAESAGILSGHIGDRLGEILSGLPCAAGLSREDFAGAMEAAGVDVGMVGELAEFLFQAGLLGNFDSSSNYVQFRHRRDTYSLKRSGPWLLHRGVMYAFNIPYGRGRG